MGYDLHSLTPARDWEETAKEAQNALRPLPEGASIDEVAASINEYYERLESAGDYMRFNIHLWPVILRTAIAYGWQPEQELNYYLNNGGDTVNKEDARALASALEAALIDGQIPAFLQFKVKKFIAFCRRDGFEIW